MQEFPIGTQMQGRYVIEDLLGQGGSSAVYIVRDHKMGGKRFALKALNNQSRKQRERFLFECEVLKRLEHPALPSVSHIFEDNNKTYMLMEYIEGLNLEMFRLQQAQHRFALSEVLLLLTPIIDAVIYLHSQPAPVLHRDIKPANIMVKKENRKTVLIDLGIAKEYHLNTTTTALRHCSAGYSAPEQYTGVGTDPRSDIYSLGATCYALLTGLVPIDALYRTTMLATKGKDPLLTVNEIMPALPIPVTSVIHRALAMNAEQRFATVAEFWQTLENATTQLVTSEQVTGQKVSMQKSCIKETRKGYKDTLREDKPLPTSIWHRFYRVTPTLLMALLLFGTSILLAMFLRCKHTTKHDSCVS